MRYYGRKATQRFIILILISVLISEAFFGFFKYSKLIKEVAIQQLDTRIYDVINEGVVKALRENNFKNEDFITFERDNQGNITAISANAYNINFLKIAANRYVIENTEGMKDNIVKIHTGNLMGSKIFAGRGPEITVNYEPVTSTVSDYYDHFMSVGINQTKYQIKIDFTVSIGIMALGMTNVEDLKYSILVAETVIIGKVPEVYFGGN